MFETAVVAVDLSTAEQPILDCLPGLAQWGVRRLVLTHVIEVGYMQGAQFNQLENATAHLKERAQSLLAEGFEVEVCVRLSGVPAEEILMVAREARAQLVVAGSRSRKVVSNLFLGSVARELLNRSPVPVLLEWLEPGGRPGSTDCHLVCDDALRHVMCFTDFSPHAQWAERAAVALARRARHIDFVHVATPDRAAEMPLWHVMAGAALEVSVKAAMEAGAQSQARVETGDPMEAIPRLATAQDASLIVLGKNGQSGWRALTLGSTAAHVCEIAARPVLLVPHVFEQP